MNKYYFYKFFVNFSFGWCKPIKIHFSQIYIYCIYIKHFYDFSRERNKYKKICAALRKLDFTEFMFKPFFDYIENYFWKNIELDPDIGKSYFQKLDGHRSGYISIFYIDILHLVFWSCRKCKTSYFAWFYYRGKTIWPELHQSYTRSNFL